MSEIKLPDYNSAVKNIRIYDLQESILASNLPMRTDEMSYDKEISEKDIKRIIKLTEATKKGNGAHNQFASGILVSFDWTFSNKLAVELERYRFLFFVSSQSTMHRIAKFKLNDQFNEHTDPRIVKILQEKIDMYNAVLAKQRSSDNPEQYTDELKSLYLDILYSNPAGFTLTARMTTNYRCLRNIYIQRKDHRLDEWKEFCKWIETLPYANELLIN